jgi:hypothetical protein
MSGFDILQFTTTYINQGYLNTSGVDYDFKYRLKFDQAGLQFPLRLFGTYTREYTLQQAGVVYHSVGTYNDDDFGVPMPRYTANASVGVVGGPHSLLATVRYIPALKLQSLDAASAGTESKSFTTLDLLYRYDLPWSRGSSVTAAIKNVTNAEDPIAGGAQVTTFGNTYNFLGRVFRVGVDYKF